MIRTFLIFIFLFFLAPYTASCKIVDKIVATVNDDVITFSEMDTRARPIIKKYEAEMGSEFNKNEFYAQLLAQLIDEKLVQAEIEKRGMTASDEEVMKTINSICAENRITLEQLKGKLSEKGITFDDYKKDIKSQMEKSRLINAEVRSKVVITEQQIDEYIKEGHSAGSPEELVYYLEHLSIKFNRPQGKKEAERLIKKALKLVKEGKTFAEAASINEKFQFNHGDFTLREMSSSTRQAVKKLEPGQTSSIIEGPSDFHIIKLAGLKKGQEINLGPQGRESIRQKLQMKFLNARFEEWLKNLRSKSTIKILY